MKYTFLTLCPAYQEKRKNLFEYLNKEYRIAVNRMALDDVFLLLINPPSKNKPVQKLMAKYVFDCYDKTPNKVLSCLVLEVPVALSRLSPESQDPIPGMNVQIHEIFPQFSSNMLQKIKEQSSLDAELNALQEMIHAGWPAHIQQVPTPLKAYWPYRDELATEDGIVMKAPRIIIPATLQKEILTKLHAPHKGTERTKLRARTSVYWRGLYKDIEETTKTCSTCEELQHSQQKEPLITTEVPPSLRSKWL